MKKIAIGTVIFLSIFVLALCFASFSNEVDLSFRLSSSSLSAPLGYDALGRDLLGRVSAGTLVSLAISTSVAFIALACGIFLSYLMSLDGHIAGLISILCDSLKSIPAVILALFLASVSGPSGVKLIVALSLVSISNIARTFYQKIMVIRKEPYVTISEGFGIGRFRVFALHILPPLSPYIREQGCLIMLSSILTESSLSYLGCGVKVTTPSLGTILAEARPVFLSCPWLAIFPAIVLLLLGLSLTLISRGFDNPLELDSAS